MNSNIRLFSFGITAVLLLLTCFVDQSKAQDNTAASNPLPEIAYRIHTMAHRGHPTLAPENTIPGFKLAIASGVDSCEFDVYSTSDGKLVLTHDGNFKRCSQGACDRNVTQMTWEEVQKVDVGAYKGEKWRGTKVPTLDETLDLFKNSGCIPVIEIKQPGTEEGIAEALKARDMVRECAIVSFNHESIRKMQTFCPGIYAYRNGGGIGANKPDDEWVAWFVESQKDCPYKVANPHVGELNEARIRGLLANGFHVSTWIINDPERLNRFYDYGCSVITSDRPDVQVEVWKQRQK